MQVHIRVALENDYQDIYRINKDALGYDFDVELTRERLKVILQKASNRIFVAEVQGKIVGYIHGADYDCTYSESLKNILALSVAPDQQGLGVGRRLIAAVEDWARLDGAVGVRLVSGYNRLGAHAFYQACGYHMRKEQKNFIKFF